MGRKKRRDEPATNISIKTDASRVRAWKSYAGHGNFNQLAIKAIDEYIERQKCEHPKNSTDLD